MDSKPARVLYVEDSEEYRYMVSSALEKFLGLKIQLASSGHEAIALVEQGHLYDVIISDYSMPNGNGADLFRYINQKNIAASFILFTNYSIDPNLQSQFQGESMRGIVSKAHLRELSALVVIEIAKRGL